MLKIIIPNYNKGPYLKELFDSLEPQMTDQDVMVFVDDHSTDKSVSILKKHPIYKKTILIENKGKNWWCAKARNMGMDYVTRLEDWFCFIDSDDYVNDNYIETLHRYMREDKAPIYCFSFSIRYDSSDEEILPEDRLAIYTRLYKGEIAGAVHLPEKEAQKLTHCGEDIEFAQLTGLKFRDIIYTDDNIYNYRLGVPKGESELSANPGRRK